MVLALLVSWAPAIEPRYQRYQPPQGSIAARVSEAQRTKLFQLFTTLCRPNAQDFVLDVGVTANRDYVMNNYFELLYPYKDRITATGLEPHSDLPERYPGLTYVQVQAGRMPFADGSFDVAHSSAVVEHVGSREQQAEFMAELWRVSRRGIFVTTPNRWFPIEFHTVVPFLHWLPPALFRRSLRALHRDFYADEAHLNLLDRRSLLSLAAEAGVTGAKVYGVHLLGSETNLALVAAK